MRRIIFLLLALFSFNCFSDDAYDQALQSGIYEFDQAEFKGFPERHPFSKLHKPDYIRYERDPLQLEHAYIQSVLAERLNLYSQDKNKKIHTAIYVTDSLTYKAIYESGAISVTASYKTNNQQHSKIWFYKSSAPSIRQSLEKNQSIKVFWPSGKLQSQEYFCSGVPVGYAKYFDEDGKLYGVIDWTRSDYELPKNKLYTSSYQIQRLLIFGKIYLSEGGSLVLNEKLSTLGANFRPVSSLSELDAIPFYETYQRHKLGIEHQRALDENTQLVLKCPWLDEAMSYAHENPQFALPAPQPITTTDLRKDPRNLYDECMFKPNVDCLSHFAFEQTKNDSNANAFYSARRIFTALETTKELNQTLQIMRQRGMIPSTTDFERKVNIQSDTFKKIRAQTKEEIRQAEIAKDNIQLVKILRKPVYIEALNIDLSAVDELGRNGADRQIYLMALAAAAEVYADKNQLKKAKELLSILERNLPRKQLKDSDLDRQIINNIRAEMAIAYSRIGMADLAEIQLLQIEYSEKPIIHGTYFAAYGWINSALLLCRQEDTKRGTDFLSTGLSMQKNNSLQVLETLKQALEECKYPFDFNKVPKQDFINKNGREIFSPQKWLSYQSINDVSLPIQDIGQIESQKSESETKDGTYKNWIYQRYFTQKVNALFASSQSKEAKLAADDFENLLQAGSWYTFAPIAFTKVGRLRAKYGDCVGALKSFEKAALSLQLNKMNVNSSFVIRHPHYAVLPSIAQGMAYCGASVQDIQNLQIDFDYSAPSENIQNNRRADTIEIERAIGEIDQGNLKAAINILDHLNPTDLKINALVAIARRDTKTQIEMKPILVQELNHYSQYFGTQHGAKEQRRAIGSFLDVLDMYFEKTDSSLPIYITKLGRQAVMIPQEQFKARAMCQLGYFTDKKQMVPDKNYFAVGLKISNKLSWAYASPAGTCAFWLNKAGRTDQAKALLDEHMAAFRKYKTDTSNMNGMGKYATGEQLANAAFVYWEYEHGEMPSKYDEVLSYYKDSPGLIEAY
jgi:hypothetical protein